jgi:hypothetical protein
MRFFFTSSRLRHERDAAVESAERFAAANLRLGEQVHQLADANIRLTHEVIRLSQRAVPAVVDGDVEQPKSTRDNDTETVTLESPERGIRPEARPARIE